MSLEGKNALSFAITGYDALTTRSIDDCPICGYSLEGLPAVHRCPECGLEYDEYTQVWRADRIRTFLTIHTLNSWMSDFGAVLMALAWRHLSPVAVSRHPVWWALHLLLMSAAFVHSVATAIYAYRKRPFVALTPMGIVIRLGGSKVDTIPWTSVEKVVATGESRQATLSRLNPKKPITITSVLRNQMEATAIANAVEVAKFRYASTDGPCGSAVQD